MRPRNFSVLRGSVSQNAETQIRRSFRSDGLESDAASFFLQLINARLLSVKKNVFYEGSALDRQPPTRARTADQAHRKLLRVARTLMAFLEDKSAFGARNQLNRMWLALLVDAWPDFFSRTWMAENPDAAFRRVNALKATTLLGLFAGAMNAAASVPGRKGNPSAASREILFWSQVGEALNASTGKRPTAAPKGLFSDVCRVIALDQKPGFQVPSRTILEQALCRLPKLR